MLPFLTALAPFAPVIGAGISAIGGLIGGGKQTTTSSVDYKKLVRDAEAAGFNPLTALRNGGAAGFASTSSGGRHTALAGFLGGVGNMFNAIGDVPNRVMEQKLAYAQLENLQADTRQRNMMFQVPSYTGSEVMHRGQSSDLTSAKLFHHDIDPYAGNSDAELFERRYSDIGGNIAGVANIGLDLGKAARQWVDSFAPGFLHVPTMVQQVQQAQNTPPEVQPFQTPPRGVLDRRWVLNMPGGYSTGGGF